MRLLVFYDLPMNSKYYIKEYTNFRKSLLRAGYIMIQYSIYSKLCLNQDSADRAIKRIEKELPKFGNVRLLTITEKQYQKMKIMVGSKTFAEENQNDQRLVII